MRTPPDLSRRRAAAAALITAAIVAEAVVAQLTLAVTLILAALGRVSRWRLHWLAVPAVAGLAWALVAGIRPALGGASAGPRLILTALTQGTGLAHLSTVAGAAARRLPGQVPLALLAGAVQAGLLLLGRRAGVAAARPGLLAIAARRMRSSALAAGETVTADGCAIGVQRDTGRLAGFSWMAAERGVLLAGCSTGELVEAGLPVACAALRRRKAVVVVDLSGAAELTDAVGGLAGALGVPTLAVAAGEMAAGEMAAAAGLAIRRRTVVLARAADLGGIMGVLTRLRDLRLRGDSLVWAHGVRVPDTAAAGDLVALGGRTGAAVLLSTASPAAAAALAGSAEVVVAAGPLAADLATALAARVPAARTAALPAVKGDSGAASALIAQPGGGRTVLCRGRPAVRCVAVPLRTGGRA